MQCCVLIQGQPNIIDKALFACSFEFGSLFEAVPPVLLWFAALLVLFGFAMLSGFVVPVALPVGLIVGAFGSACAPSGKATAAAIPTAANKEERIFPPSEGEPDPRDQTPQSCPRRIGSHKIKYGFKLVILVFGCFYYQDNSKL